MIAKYELHKLLKEELKNAMVSSVRKMTRSSVHAPVGWYPLKSLIAICDQLDAKIIIRKNRLWRTEDHPDKIVVEIRGPYRELGLLQRKEAVVVPRTLQKHGK